MAEPYQIHGNSADEIIPADIQSGIYEHIEEKNDYIRSNYTKILCDGNKLGEHKGDYVSIECRDLDNRAVQEDMIDATQKSLQHMSDNMHVTLKRILVVELGGRSITSDALGPQAANEILVTAHLYEHEDPAYLKRTRNVTVLQPGVMGQIGLESLSIVQSVVQNYQPGLVIAIGALVTRSVVRINRVAQISNTGIQSGSDVGNHRTSLCEKSLHISAIAIGVATVTSIGAILHETLEVSGEEERRILQEIQDNNYLNLAVTPKSTGDELKHLVYIVSKGLNRFLYPNYKQL